MVLKKIPSNVQSLLSASIQMTNYCQAIKELVYNALDADATSIAIRVNLQENSIQVIDNGCGVCEIDFKVIGQKYMTSNLVDLSTLKSAPNKYGFHGQALANLISLSKNVRVVARHEKSEETWMKFFEHGREKQLKKWTMRPSKGTTVEINGFLYYVQKKSKDILGDIHSIKTFLEHLSLVHNNISMSLRDDSKNEIIFKMHKNRDMFQTLSTLYHIEQKEVQELRVEKNEYKVTAFIGKIDKEIRRHYIFLNGRFISSSSKLHEIVKTNLSKNVIYRGIQKSKAQSLSKDNDNQVFQAKTPFYFIFIKCPYMDYVLSNSPKQSVLEFKEWNQVKTLLEKLIKFFNGDMNLKEVSKKVNNAKHEIEYDDTKKQVKKIIENILGSQSKRPGISHMQNGIKGKQVKRRTKKLLQKPSSKITKKHGENQEDTLNKNDVIGKCNLFNPKINKPSGIHKVKSQKHQPNKCNKGKENISTVKTHLKKSSRQNTQKSCLGAYIGKTYNSNFKKTLNNEEILNDKMKNKQKINKCKKTQLKCNNILRKFELESDSVKKRCNELDKIANEIINKRMKRKHRVYANENIQYSNITDNNVNYSIRKQIDEIVIHDYFPRPPEHHVSHEKHALCDVERRKVQSNYDLIQTILKSQQDNNLVTQTAVNQPMTQLQTKNTSAIMRRPIDIETGPDSIKLVNSIEKHNSHESVATYQSHKYNKCGNTNNVNHDNQNEEMGENDWGFLIKKPRTFITKQSIDRFLNTKYSNRSNCFKKKYNRNSRYTKSAIEKLFYETSKLFSLKNHIMGNAGESSYTIEFTESDCNVKCNKDTKLETTPLKTAGDIEWPRPQSVFYNCVSNKDEYDRISINTNTYTVTHVDYNNDNDCSIQNTYTIENCVSNTTDDKEVSEKARLDNKQLKDKKNIFISTSQDHEQTEEIFDPRNVCETILDSQDIIRKEFELSFNSKQNDLPNNLETAIQNHNHSNAENAFKHITNKSFNADNNEHGKDVTKDLNPNQGDNMLEETFGVSHHFSLGGANSVIPNEHGNQSTIVLSRANYMHEGNSVTKQNISDRYIKQKNPDVSNFNFKNRLCFLPKGMSPIFQNCYTKTACEYNLSEDYYEDEMYNNFAEKVRNNAEIFEAKLEEVNDATSKAIDKVNTKINKDNASLKFEGRGLKEAKVLGQIDEKFIAAIIKGGHNAKDVTTNFLVLFDQHAVHERIRLENNLSEYIIENQWKSVNIDEVTLKMPNEHILYLHNYKDKFAQLGLQWMVLNNEEVSFTAIPGAILGKNPRQVDRVIQAVKNLISEEINIMNIQGGCVSLYPKSIMELVFSEACRYAIKFGDKLSKGECVELLDKLSACKTPFQCAHGRPVMAVITDLKLNTLEYKVNFDKVMKWNALKS